MIDDLTPLSGLTSLTQLDLSYCHLLSDIEPLVNNQGLASGDFVGLQRNRSLSDDSINTYIPTLLARGVTVYWDTANAAPNQPGNISPADGATDVALTPTLESTPFSDPDADTQAASEWQITTTSGDYTTPVFDLPSTSYLTNCPLPSWTLAHSTTYYWRGRHLGNNGPWSEWSSGTSFTTCAPTPIVTPVGDNVTATSDGVATTFDNVTVAGETTYTLYEDNPVVGSTPPGFGVLGLFVEIATTATCEGPITIGISYDPATPNPEDLRLFHWYGGVWTDVTTWVDTVNSVIYGEVDSLSPFFVGQPTSLPPVNLPPVVTAGGDAIINEGATFAGSVSFTDPDGSSWTATVDYGDGSVMETLTLTGNSFDLSHVYADDGTYTVTVTVTDDDGGMGSDTLTVTVLNVAPTVEAGADQSVQVFDQVSFTGEFSDPGLLDTHTLTWDFGDGTTAAGTLTLGHTYNLVGKYTVTLTVMDDDAAVGIDTLEVEVIQKYAIWANSTNAKAIQWSGSGTQINGHVHSNGGISMSGSNNAISGTVYYISKFAITGSSDHCTASQQLSSPRPMPVHYDLSAYQPGGTAAQAAGKYQYINGNFNVSKSGTVLDGLYYVKGNVSLSASNIRGTFTIVAQGTISISGSGMNGTAYSGDLLFFSNGASLNISGSNSTLGGIVYVPNGQISISGSNNTINGSLFGDRFALSGSNTKITVR
jgi:hypothetical protein